MRSRFALGTNLWAGVAAALFAVACSSDDDNAAKMDGGAGGSGTGGTGGGAGTGGKTGTGGGTGGATDAGADASDGGNQPLSLCGGKSGADQVSCGEYIVKHIDACGDCHSPADSATGSPDVSKFLAGNPAPVFDLDPTDDKKGLVYAPNLTMLKDQGWTAADLKDAFLNGKRSTAHGGNLVPVMPYSNFHNMASADADAIAAYILSLTSIQNDVPSDQPLPAGLDRTMLPIPYVDPTKLPDTTLTKNDAHYQDAVLGKYLAGELGICIDCHTSHTNNGGLDSSKFFAGGEPFAVPRIGAVTSLNITPATNGIKTWTFDLVARAILKGIDDENVPLCPPMPFGPNGAFGQMLNSHADAIAYYLLSIPGIENPDDGGQFESKACYPSDGSVDGSTPTDGSTEAG